jgi:hypothetical protein
VATSLLQKIRLAFRGWSRRREEARKEFLRSNTNWTPSRVAQAVQPAPPKQTTKQTIDLEGLQVAFLDDSGQIEHYLDSELGDVIEFRSDDAAQNAHIAPPRYRRVPARTPQSDANDRRAFVAQLDPSSTRDELSRATGVPEAFRRTLSKNRTVERAWYNFKNARASAAIERWLREIGMMMLVVVLIASCKKLELHPLKPGGGMLKGTTVESPKGAGMPESVKTLKNPTSGTLYVLSRSRGATNEFHHLGVAGERSLHPSEMRALVAILHDPKTWSAEDCRCDPGNAVGVRLDSLDLTIDRAKLHEFTLNTDTPLTPRGRDRLRKLLRF